MFDSFHFTKFLSLLISCQSLATVHGENNRLPRKHLVKFILFWSTLRFKKHLQKYYVCGHYPSSCCYLKCNVSEFGFCLHLQVKPTQLYPISRASPYLWMPAPTQDSVDKPRQHQSSSGVKTEH